MPQEDEKGVHRHRLHALVAVEGPAVAPAIITVGAQQPVVALMALRIIVGDVPRSCDACDVCKGAVIVQDGVVGGGAVVPGSLAAFKQVGACSVACGGYKVAGIR